MTEKVETSGLQGKVCALRENCRSKSVEISTNILAVVALAKRILGPEH